MTTDREFRCIQCGRETKQIPNGTCQPCVSLRRRIGRVAYKTVWGKIWTRAVPARITPVAPDQSAAA